MMQPLSKLTRDPELQNRANGISQAVVDEYAAFLIDNPSEDLPAVKVTEAKGTLWLYDGWHRFAAYEQAGRKRLPVSVTPGGKREAKLLSLGANQGHGLRRTNADKRKAVEAALADQEWAGWSDRAIANACGVTDKTVSAVRSEYGKQSHADFRTKEKDLPPETVKQIRNGKIEEVRNPAYTKAKLEQASEDQICSRCQRVGKVADCPRCAELAGERPKPRRHAPTHETESFLNTDALGDAVDALEAQLEQHGHVSALPHIKAIREIIGDPRPARSGRFEPPTLEEVRAYCAERGSKVDPELFVDHYTSQGWKVGKNPMRDWKASVRTWEKNENMRSPKNGKPAMFDGIKAWAERQEDLDEEI